MRITSYLPKHLSHKKNLEQKLQESINCKFCVARILGDKIEKNETGGACSAYVGEEKRIQGFGGETWGKETTGETQA